jgi:DNA-directed RNA polymerase specialized sigma24 family protein
MDSILTKLGLTKDYVQNALGVPVEEPTVVKDKNYLAVEDQKRIRLRLKKYGKFIIARYREGLSPKQVALLLGVSEESVRSRLRKAKLFNSSGPGRPRSRI